MSGRWHIVFIGRVQGVGFRYRCAMIAQNIGLTGWVRNLYDGTVEVEVQGKQEQLMKFLGELRRLPWIRIDDMDLKEMEPVQEEKRFRVR